MVGVPKFDILGGPERRGKKRSKVMYFFGCCFLRLEDQDFKDWGITGMLEGEIGYLHHESVHLSASAHTINLGTVTHLGISESRKF